MKTHGGKRMDKLVSVVVPVYNAEEYVQGTITSILNQSYPYLELILIDDGSTDSSLEICQQKEKLDKRIKVIQQPNAGVSVARNTGIQAASGEFILFLDSDDFIEKDMIEVLLSHLNDRNELVICGNYIHDLEKENSKSINTGNNEYKELTTAEFAADFWDHYESGLTNPPWNKLYVTSIIKENNISFPTGVRMGEDILFNLDYFRQVNQFKVIDKHLYHYIVYPNQSSRKVDLRIKDDMILFLKEIEQFIQQNAGFESSKENWNQHNYQIYEHLVTALRMAYRTDELTDQERLNYVIQTIEVFKKEFSERTVFPQSKFDKIMIYSLKNNKYKLIHNTFKTIETSKHRVKQFIKRT